MLITSELKKKKKKNHLTRSRGVITRNIWWGDFWEGIRTNFELKEHPEINGVLLIYARGAKQLWQIKIFKILAPVVHQRCNLIAFPDPASL